jgi:ribosomal-protein-alanine N-acetyltransferase
LTYTIRPLTREDLDQINGIDREAFPNQWPPANYYRELQNKMAHYIVATDDSRKMDPPPEKPHPNLLFRLLPWLKRPDAQPLQPLTPLTPLPQYIAGFSGIWMMVDEAHITNIAVRKSYQGKGVGSWLLIATFDLAKKYNASFITLEVRKSNLVAQNLYSQYGFTETGLRRGYYLDNREDAIIMSTENLSSPALQAKLQERRESLAQKLAQSVKAE